MSKVGSLQEMSYKTQIFSMYGTLQWFPGYPEKIMVGSECYLPSKSSSDLCFAKYMGFYDIYFALCICLPEKSIQDNREQCVKILNHLFVMDGRKKPLSEPQRLWSHKINA